MKRNLQNGKKTEAMSMLSLAELKRRAGKEGLPQGTIEKDYVLSIVLNAIAESELSKHLIFKGGTAIKKVYFKEARFSEDLDFTVLYLSKDQILKGLNETIGNKAIDNVNFEKPEKEKTSAGLKISVKYTGPLMHTQRIRFDFSFRENLIHAPIKKHLIDSYGLDKHEILVLPLEELFAEKVHALGSRSAPRDLYDFWFLINKEVRLDRKLIEKKFAYYGEKLNKPRIYVHILEIKNNWKRDLQHLLSYLPEFEKVAADATKIFEEFRL